VLTLERLGYVRSDGRRYRLTPRVLNLGYRYLGSLPFWNLAQPVMEELVIELEKSCSIGVLDGDEVVVALRVPARRLLSVDPTIGSRVPAYAHSMGRILLAYCAKEERANYISRLFREPSRQLLGLSREAFDAALRQDEANGWSFVSDDDAGGMCGISVPILDNRGICVAAINVSFNIELDSRNRATRDVLPKLRLAARRLSGQFG
jgi:IclR family pca regulon transcriptional regulator